MVTFPYSAGGVWRKVYAVATMIRARTSWTGRGMLRDIELFRKEGEGGVITYPPGDVRIWTRFYALDSRSFLG
jgi:hypothetical protein